MGLKQRKNIKQMIANNELALGMVVTVPNPMIAEMAGIYGCDFIRIDAEHGLFNLETIGDIVRACDAVGVSVIVRISDLGCISPLLDCGVTGIMAPHVRNAEQAKQIVETVKYYPLGRRGITGSGRAQRYGAISIADYIAEANNETLLIVQIEDEEGISNMDEIISVEGIDLFTTGAGDISQSLGIPGQTNDTKVMEIEKQILDSVSKAGKGTFLAVRNLEEAKQFYESGARALTIGSDVSILTQGIQKLVSQFRHLEK
jgi:2-keto-3-deoxy-L-rhamnonate aldolase RhmA